MNNTEEPQSAVKSSKPCTGTSCASYYMNSVRFLESPLYCFIGVALSAGVFVKLCLFGVLGLCVAVQPLSPPGLQRVHRLDMCHYCMQNVVPAEIYRPSILLHKVPSGEYDCIFFT